MPDELQLDPQSRCQRLSDLFDHRARTEPADFAGDGILHELRQMQTDANSCEIIPGNNKN